MLKQKKIFHIGAWNRNIGDWTAGYNMHRMFEQAAEKQGLAVSFHPIDSQRGIFHEFLVQQIRDEGDMLLVGGGGMIFNRPQDESVSGWAFNITEDLLKSIDIPIVVYAIGYNKFYFDKNIWPESMASHVRTTQSVSQKFSVRDIGSKQQLIDVFGLDENNIEIIPDPGMRLFDRHIDIPGVDNGKKLIGINWAGDRPWERFDEPWKENREYYVNNLRNALIDLVKTGEYQVLYIPHLEDVDVPFFDELSAGFPEDTLIDLKQALPHLYPPAGELLYYVVPFFTNIYRQIDLTLGMRGHSCIFSFGGGTPFIPIGSHNKVMYFAEDVSLGEYSIRMIDREEDSQEKMKEKIVKCINDISYKERIEKAQIEQFELLDNFNDDIMSLIKR